MAEGAWRPTAWLLAKVHNMLRGPGARPTTPADYPLFARPKKGAAASCPPGDGLSILKAALMSKAAKNA